LINLLRRQVNLSIPKDFFNKEYIDFANDCLSIKLLFTIA
jgi:hypothetical protein